MFKEKEIIKKAQENIKTIVFPEAGFSDRILSAVKIIDKLKIAQPILIGDESSFVLRDKSLIKYKIINPKTSSLKDELTKSLYECRKDKGLTVEEAKELIEDPFYFSTMLVKNNYADGMVGGAEVSTAVNLKPALQIIKSKDKNNGIIASAFIIYGKNKIINNSLVMGDCALNVEPSETELCKIAEMCVELNSKIIGSTPRVAFLSYSSKGSAKGDNILKVANATKLFKTNNQYVFCDGEVQLDSALIKSVAKVKIPQSKLTENSANILIFPNLESGNITYKAIQYFGGLKAIGPIMLGFDKPVNDLSRGCSVNDIVMLTAITVLQCDNKGEKK